MLLRVLRRQFLRFPISHDLRRPDCLQSRPRSCARGQVGCKTVQTDQTLWFYTIEKRPGAYKPGDD